MSGHGAAGKDPRSEEAGERTQGGGGEPGGKPPAASGGQDASEKGGKKFYRRGSLSSLFPAAATGRRSSLFSQGSFKSQGTAASNDDDKKVAQEVTPTGEVKKSPGRFWDTSDRESTINSMIKTAILVTNLDENKNDLSLKTSSAATWKERRKLHCARFFYLIMFGVASAIFADHTVHNHHEKYTIRSLSLQFITLVSSGFALHELINFYHCELCLLRYRGWKLSPTFSPRALRGANLWQPFIRDLLMIVPQPIPFVTTTFRFSVYDSGLDRYSEYPIDVLLLTFMFMRMLFLPRFFANCINDLRSDEGDLFFSLTRTVLDDTFLVKYTMSTSLWAVAGIWVLQILLYAYALLMFERSTLEGPLKSWASAIWLIVTTMTTVGYGDVYPTTRMGRIVAVFASFSAMAMMAITISLVQSSLSLSRTESKVVWMNQARTLVRRQRLCAGKLILATMRVNHERKKCLQEIQQMQAEWETQPHAGTVCSYRPKPNPRIAKTIQEGDPSGYQQSAAMSHVSDGEAAPHKRVGGSLPHGGGRGRARVAEVYGHLMPDAVVVAEGKWHVALRAFRDAHNELFQDSLENRVDLPAMLSDIAARVADNEHDLDEVDSIMDETEEALVKLLKKKRDAAKAAKGGAGAKAGGGGKGVGKK